MSIAIHVIFLWYFMYVNMTYIQEFKVKHHKEKDSGFLEMDRSKDSDKDDSVDRSSRSDHRARQQTDHQPEIDRKQKVQTKTKLEPSLKWKSLTMEEEIHKK